MNAEAQKQIVQGLLERLIADARLPNPQYTSVVSSIERNAIESLLHDPAGSVSSQKIDSPQMLPEQPNVPKEGPSGSLNLDLTALTAVPDPNFVVCIDFGTARSKAFAVRVAEDGDEEEVLRGFELGLGKLDGDREVYSVASSVWISNDGLMFAGSAALRLSAESNGRARLDSIKQQLSQTEHKVSLGSNLDEEINPTHVKLSYADAICFFLSFLTDLIGRELELKGARGLSRYTRRRFTIPAWSEDQRQWAQEELTKFVKIAQILADTFRNRWSTGIPVAEVKQAIAQASLHDASLNHLLDPKMAASELGISEPMAAGAGRIKIDKSSRNLVLVIDVGAGTTDFGLFLVNFEVMGMKNKQRAFPVEPKSAAIKRAGDAIDDLLVEQIKAKVEGSPDTRTLSRISSALRREGLRRYKETLFETGILEVKLANEQVVTVSLEEFLKSSGVVNFATAIENELSKFLRKVHESFEPIVDHPIMLLSGGGANLPFIKELLNKRWTISGRVVKFQSAKAIPDVLLEYDSAFQQEYPQLAVAMGGAMQVIDESQALSVGPGPTERPGPISRFPITGL